MHQYKGKNKYPIIIFEKRNRKYYRMPGLLAIKDMYRPETHQPLVQLTWGLDQARCAQIYTFRMS